MLESQIMWMMTGCRSGGVGEPSINNTDTDDYSIKAANLQPAVVLTPKFSATSNITQNSVLPFNHHHHQVIPVTPSEQGRSGSDYFYNDQQPAAAAAAVAPPRSSRWNPTPEQLLALEELYRRGIKTPTAQQIRQVTALLRHFGKIEGKNVFYWFQNHRARERQKRRRELVSSMSQSHSKEERQQSWTNNLISSIQNKESAGGLRNLSLEAEQQNKWTLSNCTILSDQESSSVLQERMSLVENNSSKQPVNQSYSATQISQPPCANPAVTFIDTKPLDYHYYYDYDYGMVLTARHICKGEETRETRTLELFPLESDNLKGVKDSTLPQTKKDTTAEFVEFL